MVEGFIIPVHISQFNQAQEVFHSLIPVAQSNEFVYAITFKIEGIIGSKNNSKIEYHLFTDLTNFPNAMPDIFILEPNEQAIRHINVFPPKLCQKLNNVLPFICIGNLTEELQKYRHLMAFLEGVKLILNNENFNSPARQLR